MYYLSGSEIWPDKKGGLWSDGINKKEDYYTNLPVAGIFYYVWQSKIPSEGTSLKSFIYLIKALYSIAVVVMDTR